MCSSMQWFPMLYVNLIFILFYFIFEGGDSQMDALIWYSWLGGIIIGTMIGANMVLEEHCRAGPRNIVITGRYTCIVLEEPLALLYG